MINLERSERIDELFDTDLKIIQSREVFSFSLDAVLLARFAYVPIQQGRLMDLCTGNGAIPLLLSKRTKGELTGIELQPRLLDMAERSATLNGLENRIDFVCGDVKDAVKQFGKGVFDIVTCNPPYFPSHQARDKNMNPHLAIARHEIHITLDKVIQMSAELLKPKGKVSMVHRPERLVEIMMLMRSNGIEPKRMQLVHPKAGKDANILLIEGTKQGREGMKVLPPIIVFDENGQYTRDVWHGNES